MSFSEELQQHVTKKDKKRRYIGAGGIAVCALGWYMRGSASTSTVEPIKQATTYTVQQGTITIGTEGAGNIQGSNLVTADFSTNSKITEIFVKAGDHVEIGDRLATQDTTDLVLTLKQAQNSLAQTQLSSQQKLNPLSPEEEQQLEKQIAKEELDYQNKLLQFETDLLNLEQSKKNSQLKLQQLQEDRQQIISDDPTSQQQQEEEQKLKQEQISLASSAQSVLDELRNMLNDADLVIGASTLNQATNDSFESNLSARNTSYLYEAKTSWGSLRALVDSSTLLYTNSEDLLGQIQQVIDLGNKGIEFATTMSNVIKFSVVGEFLSQSTLDGYFRTFDGYTTSVRQKNTSLVSAKESFIKTQLTSTHTLEDSVDATTERLRSLDQQITSATEDLNNILKSYELKTKSLEQTKTTYALDHQISILDNTIKRNPLSAEEAKIAQLQIEASSLSLKTKQEQLADATLKSSVRGTILAVNNTVGEYPSQDFISIATDSDRYVTVDIEEEEVVQIEAGQAVKIVPDVFDENEFDGVVRFISPVGVADNNGIVTYQVVIDFVKDDLRLRSGMNVSVEFIAQQAKDVLIVPIKAVFPYQNTPHVKMEDGTYRKVSSGMSDGKVVEIISGLSAGERILVDG